jgi:signal peptide peptidase SppA
MNNLWLGNRTSFDVVEAAKLHAVAQYQSYGMPADRQEPAARLLDVQGSVGVITISGSLVSGNSGFMSYFGVVGYGDIRDALVAAVQHTGVTSILLNVDSGGGAVSGVNELAQLIERVDKIKPVVTYTPGTMASAALWFGSAARYVVAAHTAIVGSIGVILTHKDYSQAMSNDGVKVTMIRSGEFKALASPYEPLSKEAEAGLQALSDELASIFIAKVASQRGVNAAVADSRFGQGREFIGKQAMGIGLVDAVGTFEDAYSKAVALGAAVKPAAKSAGIRANSANVSAVLGATSPQAISAGYNAETSEGNQTMIIPLTPEQLAALAAGLPIEAVSTAPAVEAPAVAAPAVAELPAEANVTAVAGELAQISELTAQVADLQAQLSASTAALATANTDIAAQTETVKGLAAITLNSMKAMGVPLGMQASTLDSLEFSALAAEHARIAGQFQAKFKAGGVAAPAAVVATEATPVTKTLDPRFIALATSLPSGK